jgi:hypothetical protein
MTTFTWPADKFVPTVRAWNLRTVAQISQSPYTGAVKAASSGSMWVVDATFPLATRQDAIDLQGFLEQLEGPVNPVLMFDWQRAHIRASDPTIRYTWEGGYPFTDGRAWTGTGWSLAVDGDVLPGALSVNITGFPTSKPVLYRGDLLGIGDNMVQVSTDVTSDASGSAAVSVLPGFRRGVLDGTVVVCDYVRTAMRMSPDSDYSIPIDVNQGSAVSVRFTEAIDLP